jgi:osmoprotectant transport system permease protein
MKQGGLYANLAALQFPRQRGEEARTRGMKWFLLFLVIFTFPAAAEPMKVGSKRFHRVVHPRRDHRSRRGRRRAPAGTRQIPASLYAALKSGSIDLYPEYTGTIAKEILKLDGSPDLAALNRALAPLGFGVAVPLGFNNSYALAMREERAQKLGIRSLSDLARQSDLKLGLSQEFIGRADGWPGLKAAYAIPFARPRAWTTGSPTRPYRRAR